jgi:hypothetical protein
LLVDVLGIPPTAVIAQDPTFNGLDAAFLASLHITVVAHPTAFERIAPSTLVFAPHCERGFFYPGMRGREPGLVICNAFEEVIDGLVISGILNRCG